MKKRIYLLFVALLAVSSFTLVSCSSDDDDILSGRIVGTWKTVAIGGVDIDVFDDLLGGDYLSYIQIQEDGTYIVVESDGYGYEVMTAQWVLSGNTLTISNGVDTTKATITELTDTDLTLVVLGISASYKRVDDSEREQYLD